MRKGTAELLMKGSLHSDELLGAVAEPELSAAAVHEGWWNEELGDARPRLNDRLPPGILSHMLASVAGAAA